MRVSVIDHVATLHEFTSAQLGLVTSRQARSVGWTRQQLHRAQQSNRLERVHQGVWRLPGTPTPWEHVVLAAVLGAGPGAGASHRSALAVYGAPPTDRTRPRRQHVSVPGDRHPRINGVTVHRVRLPAAHLTTVGGIPVTTYERNSWTTRPRSDSASSHAHSITVSSFARCRSRRSGR